MVNTARMLSLETPLAAERLRQRSDSSHPELWALLDQVMDPEIPALSIWQLGILQDVQCDGSVVEVTLTPTYSGCLAMHEISVFVQKSLAAMGFAEVNVVTRLNPPWTTDAMTREARARLREEGIAPPTPSSADEPLCCPRCDATAVTRISAFSGTACRAMYRCSHCHEVFDHFKAI